MWSKLIYALLIVASLSSCSTLAPIAKEAILGSSQRGIEVSPNVGKAETKGDDSVAQNANTAVSVDAGQSGEYNGAIEQVVNEGNMPIHVLLLIVLLAGWAIPSPEEMGHGVVRLIRALRGTSINN